MNSLDKKYLIDGITIDKRKDGYRVFTIPTQHFNISSLDELTNERFEQEIERQLRYEKLALEMFQLWNNGLNENE